MPQGPFGSNHGEQHNDFQKQSRQWMTLSLSLSIDTNTVSLVCHADNG